MNDKIFRNLFVGIFILIAIVLIITSGVAFKDKIFKKEVAEETTNQLTSEELINKTVEETENKVIMDTEDKFNEEDKGELIYGEDGTKVYRKSFSFEDQTKGYIKDINYKNKTFTIENYDTNVIENYSCADYVIIEYLIDLGDNATKKEFSDLKVGYFITMLSAKETSFFDNVEPYKIVCISYIERLEDLGRPEK